MLNTLLWDFRSFFLGPYPTFYVDSSIRSGINDEPEIRYYVWVRIGRFKESLIAGTTTDPQKVGAIIEKWKNVRHAPLKGD